VIGADEPRLRRADRSLTLTMAACADWRPGRYRGSSRTARALVDWPNGNVRAAEGRSRLANGQRARLRQGRRILGPSSDNGRQCGRRRPPSPCLRPIRTCEQKVRSDVRGSEVKSQGPGRRWIPLAARSRGASRAMGSGWPSVGRRCYDRFPCRMAADSVRRSARLGAKRGTICNSPAFRFKLSRLQHPTGQAIRGSVA
jgi:hypothetical protein